MAGERQSPSFPAQCCPQSPSGSSGASPPLSIHYRFQSCGLPGAEVRQVLFLSRKAHGPSRRGTVIHHGRLWGTLCPLMPAPRRSGRSWS